MDYFDERTALGQRVYQIAQLSGVSDFYITPNEPICYKQNGSLITDSFTYVPDQPLPVQPGCVDYAMGFAGLRFRVNRLVPTISTFGIGG
jgi:twitching motility protein PilT